MFSWGAFFSYKLEDILKDLNAAQAAGVGVPAILEKYKDYSQLLHDGIEKKIEEDPEYFKNFLAQIEVEQATIFIASLPDSLILKIFAIKDLRACPLYFTRHYLPDKQAAALLDAFLLVDTDARVQNLLTQIYFGNENLAEPQYGIFTFSSSVFIAFLRKISKKTLGEALVGTDQKKKLPNFLSQAIEALDKSAFAALIRKIPTQHLIELLRQNNGKLLTLLIHHPELLFSVIDRISYASVSHINEFLLYDVVTMHAGNPPVSLALLDRMSTEQLEFTLDKRKKVGEPLLLDVLMSEHHSVLLKKVLDKISDKALYHAFCGPAPQLDGVKIINDRIERVFSFSDAALGRLFIHKVTYGFFGKDEASDHPIYGLIKNNKVQLFSVLCILQRYISQPFVIKDVYKEYDSRHFILGSIRDKILDYKWVVSQGLLQSYIWSSPKISVNQLKKGQQLLGNADVALAMYDLMQAAENKETRFQSANWLQVENDVFSKLGLLFIDESKSSKRLNSEEIEHYYAIYDAICQKRDSDKKITVRINKPS